MDIDGQNDGTDFYIETALLSPASKSRTVTLPATDAAQQFHIQAANAVGGALAGGADEQRTFLWSFSEAVRAAKAAIELQNCGLSTVLLWCPVVHPVAEPSPHSLTSCGRCRILRR